MLDLILTSISTIISNMIIFLIIPFVWWLIKHRKNISFFKWIGLIKPELKGKWWMIIIFIIVCHQHLICRPFPRLEVRFKHVHKSHF